MEVVENIILNELMDSGIAESVLEEYQVAPPPSKLPAYIPEIDLENLPAIDLNRFLGQGKSDYTTWVKGMHKYEN